MGIQEPQGQILAHSFDFRFFCPFCPLCTTSAKENLLWVPAVFFPKETFCFVVGAELVFLESEITFGFVSSLLPIFIF